MAKKKKKRVIDKLAKKRGRRTAESRLKHKRAPKKSRKKQEITEEQREAAQLGLLRSPLLLSAPGFSQIHFDPARLEQYLNSARERNMADSQKFLSEGLRELADEEFLSRLRIELFRHIRANEEEDPESAYSASLVLSLTEKMEDLSAIPFFAALFVREVKEHPLADDPLIWRLLSPYLPSRIVTPEDKAESTREEDEFKKSEKYPHLILPKDHAVGLDE